MASGRTATSDQATGPSGGSSPGITITGSTPDGSQASRVVSPTLDAITRSPPPQSPVMASSPTSSSQPQRSSGYSLNPQHSPSSSQSGRTRLSRPSPLSRLNEIDFASQDGHDLPQIQIGSHPNSAISQTSDQSQSSSTAGGSSTAAPISSRYSRMNGASPLSVDPSSPGITDSTSPTSSSLRGSHSKSPPSDSNIAKSPCFIHSHLQKHGHLSEWLRLRAEQQQATGISPPGQGQLSLGPHQVTVDPENAILAPPESKSSTESAGIAEKDFQAVVADGEEEDGGSLTRQLAETATGVRELSKQLGRTRVRSNIQNILIVTKARDNRLIKLTREVAIYLMTRKRASSSSNGPFGSRGFVVYVDSQLRCSKRFDAAGIEEQYPELFYPIPRRRSSSSASINTMSGSMSDASSQPPSRPGGLRGSSSRSEEGQLRYWTPEMCSSSPHLFDFVITLGGDGTVLFTSWLFQRIVPPVMPFALGSLGFLTNFDFADYQQTIDRAIDDGIRVNLRMRFTCTVYRAIAPEENTKKKMKAIKSSGGDILVRHVDREGWEALEDAHITTEKCKQKKDKEIMCFSTRPVETFEVLNDLVVDRGPSPYVSLLELFGDDNHLTTVQADGLCISTPTGSTAYSLSAGGSLVHPQIPALLISPICPHTLSFRPMLLPDSMEVRVCVPYNSRSTAWASFDGRGRIELKQGDHIKITASKYPFPTVCADKQSTDWFSSISRTLRWNEREKQKSFVVVEEDRPKPVSRAHKLVMSKTTDTDETARKLASRSEAEKGQKRGDEMTHNISQKQSQDRGETNERGATGSASESHEDEEQEEEEEDFDIDDVSVTGSGSSTKDEGLPVRKFTTKVGVNCLGQNSDGLKSGVDTPDRFATPYISPAQALSPERFMRELDKELAGAGGLDRHVTDAKPAQSGSKESRSKDSAEERGHRPAALRPPVQREYADQSSVQTPRPSRSSSMSHRHHRKNQTGASTRNRPGSQEDDEDGVDGSSGMPKAFAFYGQDESDSGTSDSQSDA